MISTFFSDLARSVVAVRGTELALYGGGDGPGVILLHGFPELAFSWRHQLPVLIGAGYDAVAVDQRGYGASSRPEDVGAYALEHLVDDIVGLIEQLGHESAVLVGHDWGSIVAWSAAVMAPERVAGIVSLNVPYRGWCCGFPTTSYIEEHLKDRFAYVLAFQEPGVMEASFSRDPEGWLRRMYAGGGGDLGFMTEDVFGVYRDAFVTYGLTGPLNYYRNIDANAMATAHLADAPITQSTLMLGVTGDPILPASLTEGMERWIADLDVRIIEDCGHWSQQERPDQVNRHLLSFLERLPRKGNQWS